MQKKSAPFQLPAVLVGVMGFVLAMWVCFGRHLVDKDGPFTVVFVLLVGIPVLIVHLLIVHFFLAVRRQGHQQRRATVNSLLTAWVLLILLGLLIPDRPVDSLETILTGAAEPWLSLAIGVANPVGIIGLGLTVAGLILARGDAQGHKPTEDELLDAAGL